MITVQKLTKHYRDTKRGTIRAAQDISFEAHPGEVVGLLGCNGAGKTTTLRMLSTIIQPTSGEASVNGFSILREPEKVRKQIGFLSNSTALYGRLQPVEMLQYFGRLCGMTESQLSSRIEWVLDVLKIRDFQNQLCDKLSTGQKQRVSIARAILHDPPVLFFDEPTAGLDVVTSQTILEFIEEFRAAGKCIIYSTHIMSEIERLCNRVVIIHEGELRATGTAHALKEETNSGSFEEAFLKIVGYNREANIA